MIHACSSDDAEKMVLLINEGADANGLTSRGKTFLRIACENGSFECVKKLIEYGVDIGDKRHNRYYRRDVNKDTLAGTLCRHNRYKCLKLLMVEGKKSYVPLCNKECCNNEFKTSLDINSKNESGKTPYEIAYDEGYIGCCLDLSRHGGYLNGCDEYGHLIESEYKY
jgi:ankyrin repeat protein